MSVSTQQINWGINKGRTRVELKVASQRVKFMFHSRKDAAQFLHTLRKRVR